MAPVTIATATGGRTVAAMGWHYGDQVLYRYGRHAQARFVRSGRVLRDDADGLTLWVGPGTPQVESVPVRGGNLRDVPVADRADLPRVRRRTTWRGAGISGEQLMSLASSGAPPFDGRWTDFRADPAWGPLTMPDGWQRAHRGTP
jgi:hypothetical protein